MTLQYTAVIDTLSRRLLLRSVVILSEFSDVSGRLKVAVALEDPVENKLLAQKHVV